MKVTPARSRIIPKGLFTEAALAWFVVSKFMVGLPLYRIAALFKRFGGDISRKMLAASVVRLGEAVQPVINLMRDHLLDSEIVFADETTVQGKSKCEESYHRLTRAFCMRPAADGPLATYPAKGSRTWRNGRRPRLKDALRDR